MKLTSNSADVYWGDNNHVLTYRLLYILSKNHPIRVVLWPRTNTAPKPTYLSRKAASLTLARMLFADNEIYGDGYATNPSSYGETVLTMVTNLRNTYHHLMANKFRDVEGEGVGLKDGTCIDDGTELCLVWESIANYYKLLREVNGDDYSDSEGEQEPEAVNTAEAPNCGEASSNSGTGHPPDLPTVLPRPQLETDTAARKRTHPDTILQDEADENVANFDYQTICRGKRRKQDPINMAQERQAELEHERYMIDAQIRLLDAQLRLVEAQGRLKSNAHRV